MLLISCPFCGPRAELEFHYAGEGERRRPSDPEALDDKAWAAFLYVRDNAVGAQVERWRHLYGCGRFFDRSRHSVTDVFVDAPADNSAVPPGAAL